VGTADAGVAKPRSALLEARPYRLVVPAHLSQPATLVVLLHGYGSSGAVADGYMKLSQLAQQQGFLLAAPDGTVDARGQRFWNATDACCNREGREVDDVGYLSALIDEVKAVHGVDAGRVFVIGHSNGGFMAHRLACERADRVAGIVSLAGATWKSPQRCSPTRPVSVLQVHGTDDQVIRYAGGEHAPGATPYPSAMETVRLWAQKNGCGSTLSSGSARRDLLEPAGAETREDDFEGCPAGGGVSLWSMENGSHVPALREGFAAALYGWLSAHARGSR
jgi:polyhydroxybutyrate depolymerase